MQKYHLSLVTFGFSVHFHSSQTGMFPFQRWEDRCHSGMPGFSPVRKGNQQPFTSGASTGSQNEPPTSELVIVPTFFIMLWVPNFQRRCWGGPKKSLCKITLYVSPLQIQILLLLFLGGNAWFASIRCHLTSVNAAGKNKPVSPDESIQTREKRSLGHIWYLCRDRNKLISHQG